MCDIANVYLSTGLFDLMHGNFLQITNFIDANRKTSKAQSFSWKPILTSPFFYLEDKISLLWGKCPFFALTVNHYPLQFVNIQNYSQFPQFCVSFLVQGMEACNEKLYSSSFGFTSQTCVRKIRSIFLSLLSFICTHMGKRETYMRTYFCEKVLLK